VEGFAERAADGDSQEHSAEERENYHRIERPNEIISRFEGDIYEKLDKYHHSGNGEGSAAENVEIAALQGYAKNGNGRTYRAYHSYNRECERKEPVSAERVVYIAEINSYTSEIDRCEDYRVRMLEPRGENYYHVSYKDGKHTVSRPGYSVVETYVADGRQYKRYREEHSYDEENTRAVEFFLGDVVFRIGRLCFFAYDVGVIGYRAAERTAFFGVGEFNAAFYTVHIIICFLSFLFGCFRP